MAFAEYGPWGCWACAECDRVWLPGSYVFNVLRLTNGAPTVAHVLRRASEHPSSEKLVCPTCRRASFGIFEAKAATLHACAGCGGVHFGPGQYQAAFPGSEMILDGGLSSSGQVVAMAGAEVAAMVLAGLLS